MYVHVLLAGPVESTEHGTELGLRGGGGGARVPATCTACHGSTLRMLTLILATQIYDPGVVASALGQLLLYFTIMLYGIICGVCDIQESVL